MAGSMRNAMRRLGLAPADTERYAEYDEGGEQLAEVTPINRGGFAAAPNYAERMSRIVTARPRSYNEGKTIGNPYRDGIPVIMNLTGVASEADALRLVDFAGGLTYALRGKMERITSRVFLLSPASVEVAEVDSGGADHLFDTE